MRFTLSVLSVCAALILGGCATSGTEAVSAVARHTSALERIARERNPRLCDYQGVALLNIYKGGMFGIGATSWEATVYTKNPGSNSFGAPMFVNAAGPTLGLIYGGLNSAEIMLLFKDRNDAINFVQDPGHFNFTNEIYVATWGRRQMTLPGVSENYYSSGMGLAVGAIELELLLSGNTQEVSDNLYGPGTTINQIATGNVKMPVELNASIARINQLMKR